MSEANKAILRSIIDMFNGGDLSRADEFIAPRMVDHEGIPGIDANGPEGFRRVVAVYRGAFPDLNTKIELRRKRFLRPTAIAPAWRL